MKQGTQNQCTVMTQREETGREAGGRDQDGGHVYTDG